MDFYIPATLEQDFNDMVDTFGVACVLNYNATTPTNVTVTFSNKDTEAMFSDIKDNARMLRFKLSDTITKGDYLTDVNSVVHLVTQSPYKDINSYKSQSQICSNVITFVRWEKEVLHNTTGDVISLAGYENIAEDVYCFVSKSGVGTLDGGNDTIGLTSKNKIVLGFQYNADTSLIKVGDEFEFMSEQYAIQNIDTTQLSDGATIGMIIIYAEKLEGGSRVA